MNNLPVFGIIAGVVVVGLFILTSFIKSMWKIAAPNEAIIISGSGSGKDGRNFKILTGGGSWVLPGVQQIVGRLSLKIREAQLNVSCVTKQGIPVVVQGVCMYKISDDPQSITNAARRFLNESEDTMDRNIQALFDGHFRAIIGTLTVEQLINDREALTAATREAAKAEIEALGLGIASLQIKEIGDPTKYIENLAKPHIAQVQQAARVAQADANRVAAEAEQNAAAQIAEATSQSEIRQAEATAKAQSAKAEADQQGPLAQARAQQQVVKEKTQLAQLEADRVAQELESTVRKPADAEAYRLQRVAEGNRAATIAEAEADAARVKLQAEAVATQIKLEADAKAGAIQATGTSEADVAKKKLLAEAEGLRAKTQALAEAENQDAVIQQKLVEVLPAVVSAAAAPFANVKEMIVTNGADGITGTMASILGTATALLPGLMEKLRPLAQAVATVPAEPARNVTPGKGSSK